MDVRNKHALWLGFFALALAVFGEVSYSIVDKWIPFLKDVFHNVYYVSIAGCLLLTALVFYKLSYKYKLLQCLN
jgi:hypothetical protein